MEALSTSCLRCDATTTDRVEDSRTIPSLARTKATAGPSALEGLTIIYKLLDQMDDLTVLVSFHTADFLEDDLLLD